MGGGAIKKNGVSICSRLPKVAYDVVKAHVLKTLQPHVSACENVLELPGKPDFGDLDVLYVPASTAAAAAGGKNKLPTVPEIIKANFGVTDSTHCVRHGPVTSFAFGVKDLMQKDAAIVAAGIQPVDFFQVDFIRCPTMTELAMFRFYFGYGDVGGILGRVFNYYGIKFGEAGIWCELFKSTVDELQGKQEEVEETPTADEQVQNQDDEDGKKQVEGTAAKPAVDPTCTLGRVQLSNDPDAICKYASLDYSRWCQGFSSVDELVAWLTEDCALFHPRIFDRLNYEHMQRAQKRPFYIKFLNVIGMSPGKAGPVAQVRRNRQLDAIRHFGQEDRMMDLIRVVEVNKMRRSKFSGAMVADGYDLVHSEEHLAAKAAAPQSEDPAAVKLLDGKKLGQAITCFKHAVVVKKLFGGDQTHSDAPQATNKPAVEAAFNTVLDTASAEEIQQEVASFCATYRPVDPQQG